MPERRAIPAIPAGTGLARPSSEVRFAPLILLATGCYARLGGSADDSVRPDADEQQQQQVPDAMRAPPDAAVAPDNVCGVATMQGDLGTLAGTAQAAIQQGTTNQTVRWISAPIPATAMDARPDYVQVELWDGYGPFAQGVAQPGTYTIAGNNADYRTCGVCVVIFADVDVMTDNATRLLVASSGSVVVRAAGSAAGQMLDVDVTAVSFVEADLETSAPVANPPDCASPIAHVALASTIP